MALEQLLVETKRTIKRATTMYKGERENMGKHLVQAAIGAGVYFFFSNLVDGSQPVIELGALAYTGIKIYQAAKDYTSGIFQKKE